MNGSNGSPNGSPIVKVSEMTLRVEAGKRVDMGQVIRAVAAQADNDGIVIDAADVPLLVTIRLETTIRNDT